MFEPVVSQIALRSARRPWMLLLRCVYGLAQLLLFVPVLVLLYNLDSTLELEQIVNGKLYYKPPIATYVEANTLFVRGWLWLQLLVTIAVSGPLLAGEIAHEKERGTLAHILVTPLEPWRLLGGKLLGRGAQLVGLLWVGLPLFCFAGIEAGLSVGQLLGQMLVLVFWIYALGAMALLASVWSRTTRTATLGLYTAIVVAVAILLGVWIELRDLVLHKHPLWVVPLAKVALVPVQFLVNCLNPLTVVEARGAYVLRLVEVVLFYLALGSICLWISIRRLRPVYLRTLEQPIRRKGFWHPRPDPGDEPVRWRERYVTGLVTGPIMRRIPHWIPLIFVAILSSVLGWQVFGVLAKSVHPLGVPPEPIFVVGTIGIVMLICCFRSAEAITSERQHNTWEPLLLTPLSERELVKQKFRGILGAITAPVVAFLVPVFVAAALARTQIIWLVTLLLLPLYLWFLQRSLIAIGLNSSAAARNPKDGLGSTVATGCLVVGAMHLGGALLAAILGSMAEWFFLSVILRFSKPPTVGSLPYLVLGAFWSCLFLECFTHYFLHLAAVALGQRERLRQRPLTKNEWMRRPSPKNW